MRRLPRVLLVVFVCLVAVADGSVDPLFRLADQEFLGIHNASGGTQLARVVAMSATTAVASESGGFRVLAWDTADDGAWVEDTRVQLDHEVRSAAVSEETIVIGTDDCVEVYVRDQDDWVVQATLCERNGSPVHRFGDAVAISGDTIVVGAPGAGDAIDPEAGCVFTFERRGDAWMEEDRLEPGDLVGGNQFGSAAAIESDLLVVGAPGGNAAYIFERRGHGWAELSKLDPTDLAGADSFGTSVALMASSVFVGDPRSLNAPWEPRGSVTVFDGSTGQWVEDERMIPRNLCVSGAWEEECWWVVGFGQTLALLSEHHLVVGAPSTSRGSYWSGSRSSRSSSSSSSSSGSFVEGSVGSAHVFVRSDGWRETTVLESYGGVLSHFAQALSAADGRVLAGEERRQCLSWVWPDCNLICWPECSCPPRVCTEYSHAGSASFFALNEKPSADCVDVTAPAGPRCTASASVDLGSSDADGDPIELAQDPPGPYLLGDTSVTLTVTDDKGLSDSCAATVSVVDETPPSIDLEVTPSVLWPPNNKLVDIRARVTTDDNCDRPRVVLQSVVSSQSDDDPRAPDVVDASVDTSDLEFRVRAERHQERRVYIVTYQAEDSSGNHAVASAEIEVPHDAGGNH